MSECIHRFRNGRCERCDVYIDEELTRLRAENREFEAILANAKEAAGIHRTESLHIAITELRAKNEQLRKALEPLKRIWETSSSKDYPRLEGKRTVSIDMQAWPTIEECRRAAELIKKPTQPDQP